MTLDQAMRDFSGARSADEVARLLLPAIRAQVEGALPTWSGTDPGSVRQVYLTLRGSQGSEGMISDPPLGGWLGGAGQHSSRIVLGAIRERGVAACLDIPGRRLFRGDGSFERLIPEQVRGATVTRLGRMAVTHLLALPLRVPGGPPLGLLSVELRCPDLIQETARLVAFAVERLQVQVDLASLHMALLPRELPHVQVDGLGLGGVMRGLLEEGHAHASRHEPILLLGGRGVGKRWLARQIHERGGLGGPLESLEGAGLSERELDLALQSGGLVVIRGFEVLDLRLQHLLATRLGAEDEVPRVVCTSTQQRFRLESPRKIVPALWALLKDSTLTIPGLERRVDEIPFRVQDFLSERATETGEPVPMLAEGVLEALQGLPWPENLRSLRSVVRGLWSRAEQRWRRGGLSDVEREITPEDVQDLHEASNRPQTRDVLNQLQPGCRALAARVREPGAGLKLDMLQGLGGLVLAELLEQEPDPWRVARHLGQAGPRRGGNYLKPLRVVTGRLEALCGALGEPVPPALRLLDPKKPRRG